MNIKMAAAVIRELRARGVREYCLCAGARNAPLVKVLGKAEGITMHPFFEERSAAFFALGRIQVTGRPVAVVTTSGTAVGELLPAVMEAHYSAYPLVLITADRPRSYRGSGAPQAVEQIGIFSHYVSHIFDIAPGDKISHIPRLLLRPVHINMCFDEPLLAGPVHRIKPPPEEPPPSRPYFQEPTDEEREQIRWFFCQSERPLIILGRLSSEARQYLEPWLKSVPWPIYAEALSGFRENEALASRIFRSGERILKNSKGGLPFDGVIRIGSVPTLRFWRDLDAKYAKVPVLSVSCRVFPGLSRVTLPPVSVTGFIETFRKLAPESTWREPREIQAWLARDRAQAALLNDLFTAYPLAETSQVHHLAARIPPWSNIFLGNSLPIREWDLCAPFEDRAWTMFANRGANGIDGLVSTFLGTVESHKWNWGLIGDLSALYDLPGLWAKQFVKDAPFNLVVINNGGGKIFHRMFNDPLFENQHALRLKGWAEMFGVAYEPVSDVRTIDPEARTGRIIEMLPDAPQTAAFWESFERAWL